MAVTVGLRGPVPSVETVALWGSPGRMSVEVFMKNVRSAVLTSTAGLWGSL